jgi:hypothetical protein
MSATAAAAAAAASSTEVAKPAATSAGAGANKDKEDGVNAEQEITYTKYKPAKLKFGMDHPGEEVRVSFLNWLAMLYINLRLLIQLHLCLATIIKHNSQCNK